MQATTLPSRIGLAHAASRHFVRVFARWQRAFGLASPARSVNSLRPDENPKLCSAAGRAYLALPAASSLQLAGRRSESGITSLPGKHSETLFGIGQPGGCLRGASCLAAARCQDLPETLFVSGA